MIANFDDDSIDSITSIAHGGYELTCDCLMLLISTKEHVLEFTRSSQCGKHKAWVQIPVGLFRHLRIDVWA